MNNPDSRPAPPIHEATAVMLRNMSFSWQSGSRDNGQFAFHFDDMNLTIRRGERLFLHGPSGSGKSTLLGVICGTLKPQSGSVELIGTDLFQLSDARRDRFRADHIGVIFQMFNLVPYLSVLDNILLALRFSPARISRLNGQDPVSEARRLMKRLGLDPDLVARQKANQISVGQQQRVAAARALLGSPEIIIADEPTSSLDADRQQDFLNLLFAESEKANATLLMVSHDLRLSDRFDRSVSLNNLTAVAK